MQAHVVRWVADGVTLDRNPEYCKIKPAKRIQYVDTIDAGKVRVAPGAEIDTTIDVAWTKLNAKWKYWLYELFEQDRTFTIVTHIPSVYPGLDGQSKTNTVDREWTVTIDEWDEDWMPTGTTQLYDIRLTLKKQ